MSQAGQVLQIETDDGGVVIRAGGAFGARDSDKPSEGWFGNLLDTAEGSTLAVDTEEILQGIEFDVAGQKEHLETVAKLITLLGFRIEPPRAGDAGVSDAPLEGMSQARSSLLSEACIRFWANSVGEFLPASGPCKVTEDWPQMEAADKLAQLLEKAFNHFLTTTATEYYPDTSRMLFAVGGIGCQFKKVFHCPLRKRPVSEAVSIEDLIVDVTATDLENAARVTHKIMMRHARVKKLMRSGFYAEAALGQPTEQPDAVRQAIAGLQGKPAAPNFQADHRHTIYECYTNIEDDSGDERPYVVTLDRDSRVCLAIRRDWNEADEDAKRRKTFVKFPFIEALSFYCIGLMHVLGNDTNQMTAVIRELLDAGMFKSFPGFLYAKDALVQQNTNLMRVSPGTGVGLETGGADIQKVVMPLPYGEPSATLVALSDKITQRAERIGGTAEIKVAEGRQDAPVGTTLAMLEQAQKPVAAVHKGLHHAFAQEFQILRDRFRETPDALLAVARELDDTVGEQQLLAALEDSALEPASDPNTPSQMSRILKAVGLIQLKQATPAAGWSDKGIADRCLTTLGIDEDGLFLPPMPAPPMPGQAPPGPSPAELAIKGKQIDAESQAAERQDMVKAQQANQDNQTRLSVAQIQAASREKIAAAELAQREHSESRQATLDAMPEPLPPAEPGNEP